MPKNYQADMTPPEPFKTHPFVTDIVLVNNGDTVLNKQFKMKRWCFLIVIAVLFFTCKEPYNPPIASPATGYLVVEGFINAQGPTQIKLSRTTQLNQKNIFKTPQQTAHGRNFKSLGSHWRMKNLP